MYTFLYFFVLGSENVESDNSETNNYDIDKDPNYNPSAFIVDSRFIQFNCIYYFTLKKINMP